MVRVIYLEGIGPKFAELLEAAGVKTTENLLEVAGSLKGRRELSIKANIDEHKLLEWVNRADLMRVKGVGAEFSDLLEAAGVDTVRELAARRPDNLHFRLCEINKSKHIVRRVPAEGEVANWITEAKRLSAAAEVAVQQAERGYSELMAAAAEVFGSEEAALRWLDSPNVSIGGIAPRRLLDRGPSGIDEAKRILLRLEHGIYS